MLLRTARCPLLRLLVVVLLVSFVPPFPAPAIAAVAHAPQYGPAAEPAPAPRVQPKPIASVRVPQLQVTPTNQSAHAALPPVQRPIAQRLPLTFVANSGQTDARVLFQAQGMGGQLFFTPQAVVITLPVPDPAADRQACIRRQIDPKQSVQCRLRGAAPPAAVTRLDFVGANQNPTVAGADRLPGVVNRLYGKDRAQWKTQLPTYAGITYQQLYPGIDLRYDGVTGQIKSTYTVAPGADPSRIRWRYQFAKDLQITPNGDLQIMLTSPRVGATAPLTLTEHAPIAWQAIDGQRRPVGVRYSLGGNQQVSFSLGTYDRGQPLIIDPTLTYSTYLGGNGDDNGTGIAVDTAGNAYIVGATYSTNFTNTNALQSSLAGSYDAFLTKLSPDGHTVLYSTYLGGSGIDRATGVALNADGTIAIVGTTRSSDFPPAGAASSFGGSLCGSDIPQLPCEDAFAALLDASGSTLTWSIFLGGAAGDNGNGLAVDPGGNVYVTGNTESPDFPTTGGAYDTTCGTSGTCSSAQDAFVTKLAASDGALSWSTYLGGDAYDSADSIAVDPTGHAYVVGVAGDDSFLPSSPRVQQGADVYIVRFTPSGDDLVYGTYLGGSRNESPAGIAIDAAGNAYITGATTSDDFPLAPEGKALQSVWIGPDSGEGRSPDLFVTKLNPTGDVLVYSTFLGGDGYDTAGGIAIDRAGRATVVGNTSSTDFFAAPNDFPTQCVEAPFCNDAFIATLTTNGRALRFGSYLGGSEYDVAEAVAEDASGNVFLTGSTDSDDLRMANPVQGSPGGGSDAFVAKISDPSIGPDEQRCHCGLSQPATNNPVNTRTGNYWISASDLSVLTPGPAISWSRVYASQAITDTTGALSPGWQYPYAAHIITPTTEAGRVIVLSGLNNRERFTSTGGTYAPFPGVASTLVRAGSVFTQTLRDQQQLVFDAASGTLIAMRDTLGRRIDLTYTGSPARLSQIADAGDGSRALALTYTGGGQIATVSDGTRSITYTYTLGDLTGAQDVLGRTTSYTYTSHLLTQIANPLGQIVEQMQYDSATAAAKVTEQWLQDGQHLEFQYLPDTTVITTTGIDNQPDVQRIDFAPNNAMVGMSRNGQTTLAADFDDSFSPSITSDGNGNLSHTSYNANGLPLRRTDAFGQTSFTLYDSQNQPISTTDTLGVTSLMRYDSQGNVISTTVGITDTNPIGATSLYTYSYDVRYLGDSRLTDQRGPDGVVNHYGYNTYGQVITSTVGYDTLLAQTTTTQYDALGRVVATTSGAGSALARTDRTVYNADSTVAQSIQNYKNGVFDPVHPDEDVITSYGYDGLGRRIWTRDALGHYDVTHYNAAGQVDWSARNFSALGWSGGTTQPATLPAYTPAAPDANVATLYRYDGLGRTTLVTQTGILTGTFNTSTLQFSAATTRVTKTEYDTLSRPVTTTLDVGGLNLQTLTYYDGASNPIWQRDALGRWTKTDYDALSRPITTTVNYEDGDPLTGPRDADILTVTHYDGAGRVDQQIDNAVDRLFSATEAITDRMTLSAYDTFGRVISTTLNYAPGETTTDLNRMQMTAYDPVTMRMQGQRDPLGRWVSQQYDLLGRVSVTIQNCRTSGNVAVATSCDTFNPTYPDRNVPHATRYDALGRAFEIEDALGHVTHTVYDGLGRAIASTQNYVFGGGVLTDTNVTTRMGYDVLGRTTVMTDALGHASFTSFNGLGQTTLMTDTLGRVTRMGYDGSGALRWSKRNDGQITVFQLDGLGRTIATIVNYQDGTVGGSEPTDQDLITRTAYDAAGRTTQTIDPAGTATVFAYDTQDRLIGVTEHAVSGTCTLSPCNVITQYQYDRAGNRTALIDANGHVRRFSYDAADQPAEARDALDSVTSWEYDAQGRVTTQHDPRGSDDDLSYSYDDLDRLTQRSATNLGTIAAQYDALGRRTSLADGTGTTSFGYDGLSRMRSVQAPDTGHVGYDYDARGMRTKLIYPDSTQIQYGYLPDGQLKVVTGTTTLASYSYDSAGRLQAVARANGATTTYGYDRADRLADLRTQVGIAQVSAFSYGVDRLGLRTTATETLPSATFPASGASALRTNSAMTAFSLATPALGPASMDVTHALPVANGTRTAIAAPQRLNARALPLAFVPNAGQSDAGVRFQAHSVDGGVLFFAPQQVVLAMPKGQGGVDTDAPLDQTAARDRAVVRVRFVGVRGTPTISSATRLPGVANYLNGSDPSRWQTNVPTYDGIDYQQLYAGIDLHYSGTNGQLKSTYTVAPGASASHIRWRYEGAADLHVDESGNLVITVASRDRVRAGTPRTLIEQAPIAWQTRDGKRIAVSVRYTLAANGEIGFSLGSYDATLPLVIDPTLTFSTYLGGAANDSGQAIAVDSSGNTYITGATATANFPTASPLQSTNGGGANDAFVTKLNAAGSAIVYSTYLGGSADDIGRSIAVDSSGNAVLAGQTASSNFPTASAYQGSKGGGSYDAFVTKLNAAGSALTYSTYLGGSNDDQASGIALDSSSNAYVTGYTFSTNFPTASAYQATRSSGYDAFVTKLNAAGSALTYSTYLGGSAEDAGRGIAVDSSGNAYVIGNTASTNFKIASAYQGSNGGGSNDAFVTKLNAAGSALTYSTYLGGSADDYGRAIAVDSSGNAYATGNTASSNYPTASALQGSNAGGNDLFVTKLNAAGSALTYSTYLGGSVEDIGRGIAVDGSGNAYLTGNTVSTNYPTASALQGSNGGGTTDAFVSKLNAAGSALTYSSYLGGNSTDYGLGIALDSSNNAYVAGYTYSSNYPTASPLQTVVDGSDAFVSKLNAAGSALSYSTLLGGGGTDQGYAIAVDSARNIYVTGQASSAAFPTSGPLQSSPGGLADVFILKANAAGTALVYSTYLGGSGDDSGHGITVDAAGNAYVTGATTSTNFPTASPYQGSTGGGSDAFIAKVNAAGSALTYSTYLGGSNDDQGASVAVDTSGNAYITGSTTSTNFPTASPRQASSGGGSDAFISKLNAAGSALSYSSYLGGSGTDLGTGIAVDSAGSAYVAGQTYSTNFPTASAYQATKGNSSDAFVSKLNAAGSALTYSTYLGGAATDAAYGIALDSSGNAYLIGQTDSTNFPTLGPVQATRSGGYDVFASKLNAAGSALTYSTYLGGSGLDVGRSIALDRAGNAYLTGYTASSNFPTASPLQAALSGPYDSFVTVLNLAGNGLVASSYLGGSSSDQGYGIAVDSQGAAVVVGWTLSTNFPTAAPLQATYGGAYDVFVAKLSTPTRTITYTYDGLQRLTGANESPGASYAYAYDDAGNRTGVWLNGTRTVTQTFNAANQVDGFTYDAAGNLTDDGSATYGYDALGRMTLRDTTPYTYTGDGVLVDDGTTRYTQDLAAPLTQVLQTTQISTTNYLYGLDRLAAVAGSATTWYVGDALGSVRLTLDNAGAPLGVVNYNPWGTVESGSVPTFGFTGELQDAATGLVNLRARWYSTRHGTFITRDSFAGFDIRPSSLHFYQYAFNAPTLYNDPSGQSPAKCQTWPIDLVQLCLRADRDTLAASPQALKDALDAQEQVNRLVIGGAYLRGNPLLPGGRGYYWASKLLEHFMDGKGAKLDISFGWRDKTFINDPGITRATRGVGATLYDASLEPQTVVSLLHDFLWNFVRQADSTGRSTAEAYIKGDDGSHYSNGMWPLPHDRGYQGAFGHVAIDGEYSATWRICPEGYIVRYKVQHIINDTYAWHPPDVTDLDIPVLGGQIHVPHLWHKSLIKAGRAQEFDFSVSWKEEDRILVAKDFRSYQQLSWYQYLGY